MSGWIERLVSGRERSAEAVLLVISALVAWYFRFVQDDAFITYRYSRNMARGQGLVFNPGERVEGYTNFLWTLIHVIPEKLGWSTPLFSQVLSIAMMLGTVAIAMRIARRLFGSVGFSFLVACALVANMTFLGYATGGLETMMQALLLTAVLWCVLEAMIDGRAISTARLIAAGALAGLAVLTRLDSAVFLAALLAALLYRQSRLDDGRWRTAARSVAVAAAPLLVLVVPWLIWKFDYYGELLPNTFFAKSAANPLVPFAYGLFYILSYFVSYAAFLLIGRFRRYRHGFFEVPGVRAVFAVVPVWLLYICVVGADFMEFRFFVVISPLLAMLAAWLVDRFVNLRPQVLLVAAMLAFSLAHQLLVWPVPIPVLSFRGINHWPNQSHTTWLALGNLLHEDFPGGPGVPGQPVIAVAPLGVISYFSDLESIDMLGLTDATVARHGDDAQQYYPGHVKMAAPDYLAKRGVDLIIGQPGLVHPGEFESYRLSDLIKIYPVTDLRKLPESAVVVEIPATEDWVWPVIYLGGNDKVDEAIERNGWKVKQIDRTCDPEDLAGIVNLLARLTATRTCPDI